MDKEALTEKNELTEKNNDLNAEIVLAEEKIKLLYTIIKDKETEINYLRSKLEDLSTQLARTNIQRDDLHVQVEELQDSVENLQAQVTLTTDERDSLQEEGHNLERKVTNLKKKIPPEVSPSKTPQITLLRMKKDGSKYKLVRTQLERLNRSIKKIKMNSSTQNEPVIVKTWKGIPNAISTGVKVRDFLKSKKVEVDGLIETITWNDSPEKLCDIIEKFLRSGSGGEDGAAEVYEQVYED